MTTSSTDPASGADPHADDGAHTGSAPGQSAGLYPGDRGALEYETRRALVQLLKGPLITAAKHSAIWRTVLRDEAVLRARLAEVFLDLVLDEQEQLAFTRPAVTGDLAAPSVLRTQKLTFIETVMVLDLRQRLLRAGPGERVVVDLDEISEQLEVYRRAADTDAAAFAKRVKTGWSKLTDKSLLSTTSTPGRMEVSPVLAQIFDADQVAAVRAEMMRLAGEAGDDPGTTTGDDSAAEPAGDGPAAAPAAASGPEEQR